MRRPLVIGVTSLLAAVALVALPPEAAPAHGPCNCTVPAIAEPGATVRTARAYLAIWNPGPHWFGGGAGPTYLASAYHEGEPTEVVLQRARPRYPAVAPPGRFTIPADAAPGVHLVLVLDGSEGGTHGTWDYVQVMQPGARAKPDGSELHVELALVRDVLPPL